MNMHGHARRIITAVVSALLLSLPAAARAADGPAANPTAATALLSRIHIFNFGQVSPTYYRGGELKARDAADLAAVGVKTVIDLRSNDDYDPAEAQRVAEAGMKYVRIPMTTHLAPTRAQIATFLSLVSDAAALPVYVHCVEGRHRTGVMTAIYRIAVDRWTAEQAFREMKRFKFGADFLHPQFKQFVFAYRPAEAASITVGTR
jgi:uncharacterized protein (TIGR01244 family)